MTVQESTVVEAAFVPTNGTVVHLAPIGAVTSESSVATTFLWLPFAMFALVLAALANGWSVYTAAEQIVPARFRGHQLDVGGHALVTAAFVFAAVLVAFEVAAGAIGKHALRKAQEIGWSSAAAVAPFAFGLALIVIAWWAEFEIVRARTGAMESELLAKSSMLTPAAIAAAKLEIANTQRTFTIVTTLTLGLTTILTALVVHGFERVAPTLGRAAELVWRRLGWVIRGIAVAVGRGVGVVAIAAGECVAFAVVGTIAVCWWTWYAIGSALLWMCWVAHELVDWLFRKPAARLANTWRRFWEPAAPPPVTPPDSGAPMLHVSGDGRTPERAVSDFDAPLELDRRQS